MAMKFLLKNTAEYRLETESDVDDFDTEVRKDAAANGYELTGFARTHKEVKAQGEVVDDYYIVKVTTTFNLAKDPELTVDGVNFNFLN